VLSVLKALNKKSYGQQIFILFINHAKSNTGSGWFVSNYVSGNSPVNQSVVDGK
jgi:formylmethanofuran dehydrogenase subunit E-like metal-binding protein